MAATSSPNVDLSETQVPKILGVNISTFLIALITVSLRFLCRRLTRAQLWWDDWLVTATLVLAAVTLLTSLAWMVPHGVGKHVWAAKPDAVLVWAKALFVLEMCYTGIICTVKFSVLFFYWRLFKQSKIKIPIYILGGVVTCWGIANILVAIFQCLPVNAFWDRFNANIPPPTIATYKCSVDTSVFFWGISIPNIITDAALVILPIPFVWKLQLAKAQKVAISSIFVVGAFIVGVSIVRCVYIINLDLSSPDITWNFTNSQIWTAVESHIAITCACLPSLRPLLNLLLTGSMNKSGRCAQNCIRGGSSPNNWRLNQSINRRSWPRRDEYGLENVHRFTQIYDGEKEGTRHFTISTPIENIDIEMGDLCSNKDINVRTDITVQRQPLRN